MQSEDGSPITNVGDDGEEQMDARRLPAGMTDNGKMSE